MAYANVCKKLMPAEGEKRGDISSVKPSGWKQKKNIMANFYIIDVI